MRSGENLQQAREKFDPVRVLVVEDHQQWRDLLADVVSKKPEWRIIGEASDGSEAVHMAQLLQPDLILLGIGLPKVNGISAARRIREVSPTSRILFVSENRSAEIAKEALSTGAGGYIVKSDVASDLFPAIEAVLEGRRFVSARLIGPLLVGTSTINAGYVQLSSLFTVFAIG